MNMLLRYAQDDDAFSQWMLCLPHLVEQVTTDLMAAHEVLHAPSAPSCAALLAARAGLLRLIALATEGGFTDTALLFYGFYEQCARLLLLYLSQREGA